MQYNDPTQENQPILDDRTEPAQTRPAQELPFPPEPPAPPAPPRRHRRRRPRRRWGCLQTWLSIVLMALGALLGAGLIVGLVIYNSLAGELREDMEALDRLEGVEDFETTEIYARDGTLLYEVFEEGRRTEVPLDRIPFAMRWAIVATEDDTFYENPGFDPPSILRAARDWVQEGEIVSGGSTITQQLVRNIVFDYEERNEQTLRRKLKEAALSWVMTRQYSKDDILALYLNEVNFGNLAYGIEGAANVYFDKPATELTIAESAFLAGLVQAPGLYDPYTNFEAAKIRQRQVLDLMVLHGYLLPAEADAAFLEPPLAPEDLASPAVSLLAPHFTVEVRRQLAELPGLDPALLSRGGLKVYTTIDLRYQDLAERIAAQRVAELGEEYNLHNAALVAIHPATGEVLAMLGSVDYEDETIDGNVNIILSPQQPGSAMKPLTYAAAFEQGWTAADIIWDVPMAYDTGIGQGYDYEPVNYDGRFHGPVRLRDALANSYNIPAVTLLREVGVGNLLAFSKRLGIESLGDDVSQYGLSLTLGGGELTPLELTSAYATFASGGRVVRPYLITRVEDNDGTVYYDAADDPAVGLGEQVIDGRIAFLISSILSDNDARTPAMGPESPLLVDFPAAAKTGTTNDFRDNWTVGYTPHLVVGVWAGNTDNSEMAEGTSGLTGAAPIWHDFMTAVYNDPDLAALLERPGLPELRADFTPPSGLEERPICVLSTLHDPLPAEQGCSRTRLEWFRVGESDLGPKPTDVPTATPEPTPTPPEAAEGEEPVALPPTRLQIEPGLWVLSVLPLDEELGQMVEVSLEGAESLPEGAPQPNPPHYCELSEVTQEMENLSLQIFIAAPTDRVDAIRARNWAYANNVPIVPGVICPVEVVEEALSPQAEIDPALGATFEITSPEMEAEVYGVVPIVGTAAWDPARFTYYKIELARLDGSPIDWLTVGDIHTEPVVNDVLEYLNAGALEPGAYLLRVVVVQVDGNFPPPFTIQITVLSGPPPE